MAETPVTFERAPERMHADVVMHVNGQVVPLTTDQVSAIGGEAINIAALIDNERDIEQRQRAAREVA